MKISTKPLDKLFSLYIRTRDNWTCQRCHKQFEPPTNGLHCAHNIGRRSHNTRWLEENALALCYGCHSFIDSHSADKDALFRKHFGSAVDTVWDLYNNPRKRVDVKAIKEILTARLAELNDSPQDNR